MDDGAIQIVKGFRVILTTNTKIALARYAYRSISTFRSMAGKTDAAEVRRGGLRWALNLKEGIDFSIYLTGAFERLTLNALMRLVREGDTVLDIGANIGAHTLYLARRVGLSGHVYAFEPTDFAFGKLSRNLSLNPELLPRVSTQQMFLAAEPNVERQQAIYASWPLEPEGHVHPKHGGQLATTVGAAVDSLDHFVERTGIDRIDLIKIDVDGHELPVLSGAHNVLQRFRPTIVMEVSPYVHAEEEQSFDSLIVLLRDLGYSLRHASTGKSLPLDASKLRAIVPDGAGINVIGQAN